MQPTQHWKHKGSKLMNTKTAPYLLLLGLLALGSTAFARGPFRASDGNTSGWSFMTQEERVAHQAKIRSFKTFADCREYQVAHHKLMLERAQAKGQTLHASGRDFCAHLSTDYAPH